MRTVWDEPALGFLPLLECQLPLSGHLTLSSVLCTSCVGFTTVVGHFSTLDGTFPMTSYYHPGSSSAFTQDAQITFLVPFLNYFQILQEIQSHLELSLGNTGSMQLKFLMLTAGEQRRGLFLQMRVSQDAGS